MGGMTIPNVISGIGIGGGLLGASQSNKIAKAQLALQQQQAQREQGLFNQASPYYGQILQALGGIAGLGGSNVPTGGATPGAGFAGGSFTPQQLPYTNVTPGQLGPYANPTDALRLRAAEDETRQGLQSSLHNFSFGQGQRGLYGSSIEASGRDALINSALQGQDAFARQLAIGAPQEATARLQALGGLLNPGLGAGPTAAGIFGQGAQTYAGMGQQYGQQAAGAIQNYLQFQNLQNHMGQFQQGSSGGGGFTQADQAAALYPSIYLGG